MAAQMDPHAKAKVLYRGTPVANAKGAVILLHGRGGSAEDMLSLVPLLEAAGPGAEAPASAAVDRGLKAPSASAVLGLAYLAPQADGHTWYPDRFLAPREANEPWLTSALAKIASVVAELEAAGIARDRIVVSGFSQGACLSTEFVASNPARYAGLIAFTGGLIGPEGGDLRHAGELAGTPALLMSEDPDPHVPWSRVEESARELERMGARVEAVRYPGLPHTISADQIARAKALLKEVFAQ